MNEGLEANGVKRHYEEIRKMREEMETVQEKIMMEVIE